MLLVYLNILKFLKLKRSSSLIPRWPSATSWSFIPLTAKFLKISGENTHSIRQILFPSPQAETKHLFFTSFSWEILFALVVSGVLHVLLTFDPFSEFSSSWISHYTGTSSSTGPRLNLFPSKQAPTCFLSQWGTRGPQNCPRLKPGVILDICTLTLHSPPIRSATAVLSEIHEFIPTVTILVQMTWMTATDF